MNRHSMLHVGCLVILFSVLANSRASAEKVVANWEAEDLPSQVGYEEMDWNTYRYVLTADKGDEGFMVFGPYTSALGGTKSLRANWMVGRRSEGGKNSSWLGVWDVYDVDANKVLSTGIIQRKNLALGAYKAFTSGPFTAPAKHRLEFRLYTWGICTLSVDNVYITK